MTGYGAGKSGGYRVETRSVNHRHLDIQVKMPPELYQFEHKIKERFRQKFSRGRFDVYIKPVCEETTGFALNHVAAKQVYEGLLSIQQELGVAGTVDISTLASMRDIFETATENSVDISQVLEAIEAAMTQLEAMRISEGRALKDDVHFRIDIIAASLSKIRPLSDSHKESVRIVLRERVEKALGELALDEARLVQEMLFYTDKADITEELVRASSHIEQCKEFLNTGGTVGRKLDFMAQEILREVNTIASKAGQSEITYLVVEIKDQLEKVREQLQNIQ